MTAPRHLAMVRWPDVPQWLALGWLCTGPLPGKHGEWSAGMEFLYACPVRQPNGGEQWTGSPQDNGSMNKRGQV